LLALLYTADETQEAAMAVNPCAQAKAAVKIAESQLKTLEAELESVPALTAGNLERRSKLPGIVATAKRRLDSERRMLAECLKLSAGS
jgi:hypothetical protein